MVQGGKPHFAKILNLSCKIRVFTERSQGLEVPESHLRGFHLDI